MVGRWDAGTIGRGVRSLFGYRALARAVIVADDDNNIFLVLDAMADLLARACCWLAVGLEEGANVSN